MKYAALLRGVNVGGKNLIAMTALRACLEQAGLLNVRTLIQSGNVVFEASERGAAKVTGIVEGAISATMGIPSRIVLLTHEQLRAVVANAPRGWERRTDLRRNIAFLRPGVTAAEAAEHVDVKPGVDAVTVGKGVLYMSTVLAKAGQSGLPKLVGKPVYREMTIRTYGTCQKLLAMMDAHQPSARAHREAP